MREFLLISDFYIFPYTNGHVIINLYDNEILFATEVTRQRSWNNWGDKVYISEILNA